MKTFSLVSGFILAITSWFSGSTFDHSKWDQALQTYVHQNGTVDYAAWKTSPEGLNAYLTQLEQAGVSQLSTDGQLAFWINAYNAYTIKLILDHYPVASIRDIREPWDRNWIRLDGKTLSLNDIEHEILRKKFREPLIHFGVNCASVSCPRLWNRAYTAENVREQLEIMAREFINDEQKNRFRAAIWSLSSLFTWFKEDFAPYGGVIPFVNKMRESGSEKQPKIAYLEYDWRLNE